MSEGVYANVLVSQTNVQIFQIVLNIQEIITRIPGQIERQQPVYFVDALGRHMPFHLEFILSAEVRSAVPVLIICPANENQALTSVLRANFKNVGTGAKKIDAGEFAIQDAATKMDIDLASAWETCFAPGQHVEMSMIVYCHGGFPNGKCCPRCGDTGADRNNNMVMREIEW